MRALVVAPQNDDLPLAQDEVAAVANSGLDVHLLIGSQATNRGLLTAITEGEYDLLYLLTHGTAAGVMLTDGLMDASALTTYVVSGGVGCIFLNTCDSLQVAKEIALESGAAVIATVRPIGDRVAYRTGALLAHHLAAGKTFREAFRLSKPGQNEDYQYIDGRMTTIPRRISTDRPNDVQGATLAHIERELTRVIQLIDGSPDYGVKGLRSDVADVVTIVREAKSERDSLRVEIQALSRSLAEEVEARKGLQRELGELFTYLREIGLSVRTSQPWYREWAGPIISLLTMLVLFYMMGQLLP